MKVLRFKTQDDLDEWLNNNELFQCFDKDMNFIGEIQGPDADFLASFGLAEINIPYGFCKLTKELTELQMQELKKNRIVKTVVVDGLFRLSLEQRIVIKRLRKDFEDAKKVGLRAVSNDDANRLCFFNGKPFDSLDTEDGLSGEWKEIDGKHEFVPYSDDYLSEFVQIDTDVDCEYIEGNENIDFVSYGFDSLPWYAHLKI